MKIVKVEDAVGTVLAHDLTKIIPGEYKGPAFKKGHIIKEEDIEELKSMGKYHLNVFSLNEDEIHEEDAAKRLADTVKGKNLILTKPSEGKVQLKSKIDGLLKINVKALMDINVVDDIILSTLHNNTVVKTGKIVAGTKIIPLVTKISNIEKVEKICSGAGPVIEVIPLKKLKAGIVVTGTEVYEGKIKDKFAPVLRKKVEDLGGECKKILFAPDDENKIKSCIKELLNENVDIIMTSGGMSVDADDVTPKAIKDIATEVITYGSPVLPGAMFMISYYNDTPILGVPACGMFAKITVLDLILPRIFAGEKPSKRDVVALAHGGLCQNCEVCRFPICPLGK